MNKDREIRIEDKIDKVVEVISEIKIIQAKQQTSLEHHIKRTDLLEVHVERIWTAYKAVGIILTAAVALAEILGFFHGK